MDREKKESTPGPWSSEVRSPGVEILARVYIRSKLAYPTAFSGEGHDFSVDQGTERIPGEVDSLEHVTLLKGV
jgi:hypothetical protein